MHVNYNNERRIFEYSLVLVQKEGSSFVGLLNSIILKYLYIRKHSFVYLRQYPKECI